MLLSYSWPELSDRKLWERETLDALQNLSVNGYVRVDLAANAVYNAWTRENVGDPFGIPKAARPLVKRYFYTLANDVVMKSMKAWKKIVESDEDLDITALTEDDALGRLIVSFKVPGQAGRNSVKKLAGYMSLADWMIYADSYEKRAATARNTAEKFGGLVAWMVSEGATENTTLYDLVGKS